MHLDRRALLLASAAQGALSALPGNPAAMQPRPKVQPVGFVSHGAPNLAVDPLRGAGLARWGRDLPRPTAVLVISAHWEATPVLVGTPETADLIYDFGGFAPELYSLQYRAPGAPQLVRRVGQLVGGVLERPERGWDHGVWVPLLHMFPKADVPVLQISLPSNSKPSELLQLGRRLAPLRAEGVLILASGGLVHNLRALDWQEASGPESWAQEFETWAREALERRDVDELLDFAERAPAVREAHPTFEHWLPLLVALGAAGDDPATFPVEGFEYGSLSRTSVQWSAPRARSQSE